MAETTNTNENGNCANRVLATAADGLIKCRKPHKCDYCEAQINAGEMAIYCEGKTARYDKDDKQIGIHFWKSWLHDDIETCRKNGAD